MKTSDLMFESCWMILFSITALFVIIAISKIIRARISENKLPWLAGAIWVCGYALDSLGTFYLSKGSWVIEGGTSSAFVREVLFNIKVGCSAVGCLLLLIASVNVLCSKRVS